MYKVVFDTNVFVSALNWPLGNPRKAYDRWLGGKFSLVVSIEILTELMRILREEFGWLDEEAYEVYALIGQEAEVVTPKERIGVIQDDPADNRVLECALCSGANYIISGDEHLLRLGNYKEAKIIPVGKFLDLLAREAKDLINEVE